MASGANREGDDGMRILRGGARTTRWAVPVLVLTVACALRFWGLGQSGIFAADEARHLLDGQSKHIELAVLADLFRGKLAEMRGGEDFLLAEFLPEAAERLVYCHPFSAKMLYSYLAAGVMAFAGYQPWVGSLVEAVFGVLMVVLLVVFMGLLAERRVAWLAGAMLAVSCFHVFFSRKAYPQCSPAFFFLAAFTLHLLWRRRARSENVTRFGPLWLLAASGLAAGLGFTTNFQLAGALPALAVLHLLVCFEERGARAGMERFVAGGCAMFAGFLAVPIAIEAFSHAMILLFRSHGMEYPHQTYIELLLPRVTDHGAIPLHPSGLALFPYFLWLFEGPAAALSIAALLGMGGWAAWTAARRGEPGPSRVPALYLGCGFLVPFLIFSVKTVLGARLFIHGFPFFVGILALAADAALRMPARGFRWAARIALGLACASALLGNVEVIRTRSGYPEVIEFLRDRGVSSADGIFDGVLWWYLECAGMPPPWKPRPPGETRYLVSDWQTFYISSYPEESLLIPKGLEPVAVFEHRFGRIFLETEALPQKSVRTFENLAWLRGLDLERSRRILVYDVGVTGEEPAANP